MENTTQRTHYSVGKRALSIFLSLLMVAGVFVMDWSGLIRLSPTADATSGGNYYVKLYWNVGDDSNKNENTWSINYRDQDGSTHTYSFGNNNAASSTGDKNSGILTLTGVPYSIFYQLRNSGGWGIGSCRWYIKKLEISTNADMSGAITLWEGNIGCKCENIVSQTINCTYTISTGTAGNWSNGAGSDKKQETSRWAGKTSDFYNNNSYFVNSHQSELYINSMAISGETSVRTNGSTTKTYTLGTFKDQFGVAWYQNSVNSSYFSSSNSAATVSYTSPNLTGTVTFGTNNGVDYTTKIEGRIDSHSWSPYVYASTNVTVLVPHSLTVNLDGGTGVATSKTGYTGDSVSLGAPTKTGYEFDGWTLVSGTGSLSGNNYTFANEASAEVKAKWKPISYTIAYTLNGGTVSTANPTSYTIESSAITLNNPSKTGYTFKGWSGTGLTGDSNTTVTIPTGSTGNRSYTANYTANKYTVNFNKQEGTGGTDSTQATYAAAMPAIELPTRDGYDFAGYFTGANGSGTKYYNANGSSAKNWDKTATTTLYANWTPKSYNATFHRNYNSSDTTTTTVAQTYNAAWTGVPTWTRTGYTKVGWFDQATGGNAVSVTGNYTFTTAKDLYLHWNPVTYNILYNANNGSGTMEPSVKTYDSPLTLRENTFTRQGWHFLGWSQSNTATTATWGDKGTLNSDLASTQDANVNLYAVWERNDYTIRYNGNKPATAQADNNVTGVPGDQTKTFGNALTLTSSKPSLTGYTFAGWNTAADGSGTAYAAGGSMTTDHVSNQGDVVILYAQWTRNTYNVAFNSSLKTGGSMGNQTLTYDKFTDANGQIKLTANGFSRQYTVTYNEVYEGGSTTNTSTSTYHIKGWSVDDHESTRDGAINYADQWAVTDNTLYPGALNGTKNLYIVWKDGGVTLASFNRPGYRIEGWYTSYVNGVYSNKVGEPGDTYYPTANVTLYAKWIEKTYEITYNGNGGTGTAPAKQENIGYTANVTLAANTFTKNGYEFKGWTRENGVGGPWGATTNGVVTVGIQNIVSAASDPNDGKITLYAKWELRRNTITYTDSKASIVPDASGTANYYIDASTTSGAVTALKTPTAKNGYQFLGWKCTASDGNWTVGTTYQAGKSVQNMYGDVTLEAQWTPITYTFVYDANAGTDTVTGMPAGSEATLTKTYRVNATVSAAIPERAGYDFAGWKTQDEATQDTYAAGGTISKDYRKAANAANVVLYAQWTEKTRTVKLDPDGGKWSDNTTAVKTFTEVYRHADTTVANPTRDGYTFGGWSPASDYAVVSGGNTVVKYTNPADAPVEVTAIWNPITYTFTFDQNTTDTVTNMPTGTITKTYGVESAAIPNVIPQRAGWTFTGWNTAANGSGDAYQPNGTINTDYFTTQEAANAGKVLYAQWRQNTSAVYIYKEKNGDTYGDLITSKTDGHYNENLPFNAGTKLGHKFVQWAYETPFHGGISNVTGAGANYTFGPDDNVTDYIWATWTPIQYPVKFDANVPAGVTATPANIPSSSLTKTWGVNSDAIASAVPTLTGWTFKGWTTNADGTGDVYQPGGVVNKDYFNYETDANFSDGVTLYAKWEQNKSKVTVWQYQKDDTFYVNIANELEGYSGSDYTLVPGTRTGYVFDHWAYTGTLHGAISGNTYTYGPDADTEDVIYGVWTPITYTITYNANKPATATGTVTGMPEGSITKTYDSEATVSGATPTLAGWTFQGWNTKADGTGDPYQPNGTINKDYFTTQEAANAGMSLYAQWTQNESTVEVYKEKVNGVLTTKLDEQTRKSGTTIDVNAGTKTGYHFTGWAFEGTVYGSLADATLAATTYTFGNDDGVTAKIYGTWEADFYTVTFNANAPAGKTATGSVPDLTNQRYDSAVTLNTNNYVVDGYTFLGWAKTANATAATYEDGATVTDNSLYPNANNGTMTLYAIWVQNESTLNLNLNGGSGIDETNITKKSGETYTVPTPTAPEGMVFTGWQKSDPFKGTLTGTTYTFPNDAGNVDTLTAQYAYKTITVTYQYGEDADPTNDKTVSGNYSETLSHLTAANFTAKTGYTLKGWAENPGDTTVKYALGSEIAKSLYGDGAATAITVFAIWEINKSTLTVDPNGGTWNNTTAVSNIEGEYNTTYTVTPDPTRDGYTFTGWEQSGSNGSFNATSKVYTYGENTGAGLTLTAQWSANTYNIVFHDTESDQTNTQANVVYDTEGGVTLNDVVFTKEGYHMIGWATAENGGKVYDLKAQLAKAQMNALLLTADSDRNVHLWVVWEINKSKVTVY